MVRQSLLVSRTTLIPLSSSLTFYLYFRFPVFLYLEIFRWQWRKAQNHKREHILSFRATVHMFTCVIKETELQFVDVLGSRRQENTHDKMVNEEEQNTHFFFDDRRRERVLRTQEKSLDKPHTERKESSYHLSHTLKIDRRKNLRICRMQKTTFNEKMDDLGCGSMEWRGADR